MGEKYTCLFGGGAIRGISYVGVQRAVEELGLEINTYGGSSVGSMVAALLAVGYNADELCEIFLKINFNLFKDIQLKIGSKPALSKGNVFLEWVRKLIETKFYGGKYKPGENRPVTFADIDKNLVIITTNLSNYSCQEFSRFVTPDFEIAKAVRISCTMPGLMRPVEYDDAILVDGDLQKSRPMWQLSPNLLPPDERVLEFRLEGFPKEYEMNAVNFANTVYSCMTAVSTAFIADLYGKKDKFDYIIIDTGSIIIVDFSMPAKRRKELIQLGYDRTIKYFREELPRKKACILEEYRLVNSHLLNIKKCLDTGEIVRAKNRLHELFSDFCDLKEIVDFCGLLKDFKVLFVSNIEYPALFGRVRLQNAPEIQAALDKIMSKISDKISGLEKYLAGQTSPLK